MKEWFLNMPICVNQDETMDELRKKYDVLLETRTREWKTFLILRNAVESAFSKNDFRELEKLIKTL